MLRRSDQNRPMLGVPSMLQPTRGFGRAAGFATRELSMALTVPRIEGAISSELAARFNYNSNVYDSAIDGLYNTACSGDGRGSNVGMPAGTTHCRIARSKR